MQEFMKKVETLRWDDHRYYHQCRINQTLHLISALSFLVAYVVMFFDPATAALIGWLVGMVTRQSGHMFFEPRSFDTIHNASYEYKESIKAGFNMRRKAILLSAWVAIPVLLWLEPSVFGWIQPANDFAGFAHDLGLVWFALGASGLVLRTVQLSFLRGPSWGLAWATKIITDPFHNVDIYWRSPIALLRGERYDPLTPHTQDHAAV
ncbi:MAG: hypothetical protein RIR09_2162 [Pseudomonadota bacterium]|jgi:hypothetical protein